MKIRYSLRIVPELDEKIEQMASEKGLTKNAFIVKVLWDIVNKSKNEIDDKDK